MTLTAKRMSEIPPPQGPVVFVGAATLDAIALVEGFPQPDGRQVARAIAYAGGGPAATAAVAAARLGLAAAFVGAVGEDEEGTRILDGLRSERVDVTGVMVTPGHLSGASVVVVDSERGTRAICTRQLPPLQLAADSPAGQLLRDADWIHVDHLGCAAVLTILDGLVHTTRPHLSVDAGNPIPGLALADIDLFVPTVKALARLYGRRSADELVDQALADGARCVVATRGRNGCLAGTSDGVRCSAPAFPVDVVSTLGAGDVFHGALLAATAHGMPLQACLSYANVAAALSCRGLDGRSAIPSHADIVRQLSVVAE